MNKLNVLKSFKYFLVGLIVIAIATSCVFFKPMDASASYNADNETADNSSTEANDGSAPLTYGEFWHWDYDSSPIRLWRAEEKSHTLWQNSGEDRDLIFKDDDDYVCQVSIHPNEDISVIPWGWWENTSKANITDLVITYISHTKDTFSKVYTFWTLKALDKDKNELCVCKTKASDFLNDSLHTEHIWQCDVVSGDPTYAQSPWQENVYYWYVSDLNVADHL